MNAAPPSPYVKRALAGWLCVAASLALTPARAQLLPGPAEQPEEPGIQLDVQALLNDDRVFATSVDSTVWNIESQPGRRIVQIPILVSPKDETTRLATPSLRLRGGRFIAWRIVLDETDPGRSDLETGQAYRDDPYALGNLRRFDESDLSRLDAPPLPDAAELTGDENALPEGFPVLARDITVDPDGTIHWELERAIPGAEVKTGDADYLLKLRPDRLQEKAPEAPDRGGRAAGGRSTYSGGRGSGADPREAAEQRRAAELQYREEAQAYRELRDRIRDLPDEFQAPMPPRLWAVYEISDRIDELSFTGEPPMPWRITEADLLALRQIASRRGGGNTEPTAEDFAAVSQMSLMLADEHPLTQRVVADTLAASGMVGQARQGDAIYRLTDSLLKSGDTQAVQSTTAALAATVPPTPATLALLRGAFDQMDPGSKLLALGGLLATEGNDPVGQRQMLDTANQMIADPDGPGIVYVLKQLTVALQDKPGAVNLVGSGIKFDALRDNQLDQAVIFIADAAGTSPLAARWMDQGLLGSANQQVAHRTVELLSENSAGDGIVSRLTHAAIELTFGPARQTTNTQARPRLRGIANIPIDSTSHGIYRVLNAGDPELRALGWKALRHFQIAQNDGRRAPVNPDGSSDETDRLTLILNAAFNEMVTPPQLVTFLARQTDTEPATAALVRIVVEGRGPAITQAARSLVRSGRRLDTPLQALSPDQRGAFAVRLYEAVTGSAPMVAGLMRVPDNRSQVVNWFAQHVSSSGMPEPRDWANAANGEDNLLNLAASGDPELANAAVASLVASVGGDEMTARDVARQMSNATDRTVDGLRDQWSAAKQDIYAEKLRSAAGRYQLVVNLRGQPQARNDPSGDVMMGSAFETYGEYPDYGTQDVSTIANAPLIKRIDVATVELRADGRSVSLASGTLTLAASDAQLAIAIENPNELKDFGNPDLADLPLEDIEQPIELIEQTGGIWRGGAFLNDGRSIEVILDPQ